MLSATEREEQERATRKQRAAALRTLTESLRAAGLDLAEPIPSEARGYTLTNWVRGERVLIHERFGSYQGEWMTLALNPHAGEYRIYKDYYGSCSGCDAWEGSDLESLTDAGWNDDKKPNPNAVRGNPAVLGWALDYPPFIEIPRATAAAIAANGPERFAEVMPANMRGDFSEIDLVGFSRDAVAEIKLEENLPIAIGDVFGTPNAELRRRLMERYGVERVVTDAQFETLDADGEDLLVRAPAGLTVGIGTETPVYLYVKDSSTPRRYLLRVPPDMERVREAKAWSFGLDEHEYAPSVET